MPSHLHRPMDHQSLPGSTYTVCSYCLNSELIIIIDQHLFVHFKLEKCLYLSRSSLSFRAVCVFRRTLCFVNKCYIDFHEYARHIFCVLVCSSPAGDNTRFWQRAIIVACESNGSHISAEFCLGAQLEEQGENIFKRYKHQSVQYFRPPLD